MQITPEINFKKNNARLMFGLSLLSGLVYNYFFYNKQLGISFPLYSLGLIIVFVLLARFYKLSIPRQTWLILVVLMFFSSMVMVREARFLTFLNVVASFYLMLLMSETVFRKQIRDLTLINYFTLPVRSGFRFLQSFRQNLADATARTETKDKTMFSSVVKGLLLSLPILIVFLALFSSADLVFQKYTTDLLKINLPDDLLIQVLIVLFVALVLNGAYGFIFNKTQPSVTKPQALIEFGLIESSVILGLIDLLFLIFIIFQAVYLFGGVSNIASAGFTYADYARRGFFELIAVALLTFIILWFLGKIVRNDSLKIQKLFRSLSAILILEVIAVIASAFKRLALYEQAYGFTALRLYSHIFIILLAVIFVLLLYKILRDEQDQWFAFRSFLIVLGFLTLINLGNPDTFIAKQNLNRFAVTGKLDSSYLNDLSTDALPQVLPYLKALENDNDLKKELARDLYYRRLNLMSSSDDWQSYNFSRYQARKLLDENKDLLEANKDYNSH